MEEEVVMKEGLNSGEYLAGKCLNGALESGKGNAKEVITDGMEEDLLSLARGDEGASVLDGGEDLGKADNEFLKVFDGRNPAMEKLGGGCTVLEGNVECCLEHEGAATVGGGPPVKEVLDYRRAVLGVSGNKENLGASSNGHRNDCGNGAFLEGGGVKVAPLPSEKKGEDYV